MSGTKGAFVVSDQAIFRAPLDSALAVIDKEIPGFGEYLRHISLKSVGLLRCSHARWQAWAGPTLIFAMPGSTGACRDAGDQLLQHQLDSRYRPCNFVQLLPRLVE